MPVKPFEHIVEKAGAPLRKHGNEVLTRTMQRNWSHGGSMPEVEATLHQARQDAKDSDVFSFPVRTCTIQYLFYNRCVGTGLHTPILSHKHWCNTYTLTLLARVQAGRTVCICMHAMLLTTAYIYAERTRVFAHKVFLDINK